MQSLNLIHPPSVTPLVLGHRLSVPYHFCSARSNFPCVAVKHIPNNVLKPAEPTQVDAIEFYEARIRELESGIVAERAACLRAAPSDSFFVFFR